MRSIRETFLPDEGCIFIRVDLSQIEDRMCKMYCRTPEMVKLANMHPLDYDAHTENAMMIFKKPASEITKDMRYLGKKTTHASQRGMAGDKLSENIMKDTDGELFIHPKECSAMIDSYLMKMKDIRDIYFPWVRDRVKNDGKLETSWGRRIDLRGIKVTEDLYREAYSFYLQAEAADWTNQYGFIPGVEWMMNKYGKPLNAQVHDEIIASVRYEDAWEYANFIVNSLEQRREIPKGSGNWLRVPAEVTIARAWSDPGGVSWKRLPNNASDFYQKLAESGFY